MLPKILKETDDWLILNKPPEWHSVRGTSDPSLESWLADARPELSELPETGLVHRLDFETSGLIIAAKNLKTRQLLLKRVRSDTSDFKKFYWALTTKPTASSSFRLFFTSRYRGSKKVTVRKTGPAQEAGECRWRLLSKSKDRFLYEVELVGAGQRHQIRAGFAFLGAPLVGDTLYRGIRSPFLGLHATRLEWSSKTFEVPPPSTWDLVLKRLI